MNALEGIRVLDLTRLLPGAVATQLLRDYGAEVIKIEPPEGDYARTLLTHHPDSATPGAATFRERANATAELHSSVTVPQPVESASPTSPIFQSTNRGKKSIVLNLKNPDHLQALLTLIETADVLIEGFRPGVMQRLGLDYETLHAHNPRLIVASLTGYGQTGPNSNLAGHDLNYLSLAGVLDLIGPFNGPPVIPGVQIADLAGGAFQAVIGILLALIARQTTGQGQHVDISMTDGAASLLTIPLATGAQSKRGADTLSGRYACYNVYRCNDGRWLAAGALETKFWKNLCRELNREDLIADQFSTEPRQSELKSALRDIFAKRTAEEWFALLGNKDCCVTPVRTVAEAAREIRTTPILSATPARVDGIAPELGQHTGEILHERALPSSTSSCPPRHEDRNR